MKSLLVGKNVRIKDEPQNTSEYKVLAHFPKGECILVDVNPNSMHFTETRSADVNSLAINDLLA